MQEIVVLMTFPGCQDCKPRLKSCITAVQTKQQVTMIIYGYITIVVGALHISVDLIFTNSSMWLKQTFAPIWGGILLIVLGAYQVCDNRRHYRQGEAIFTAFKIANLVIAVILCILAIVGLALDSTHNTQCVSRRAYCIAFNVIILGLSGIAFVVVNLTLLLTYHALRQHRQVGVAPTSARQNETNDTSPRNMDFHDVTTDASGSWGS